MRDFNLKDQKEICRLYIEDFQSIDAISKIFHCRKEAIRNVLKINNIQIRKTGGVKKLLDLPEDEEKIICNLYEQGKSITFIKNELHRDPPVIKRILQKYNYEIEKRLGREKITFTEEQKNKILQMNEHYYSNTEIGKEMGCCASVIRNFLKESGIERTQPRLKNHNLNDNYFSQIDNEEKAYFLGLLKTDGYIKKGHRVGISLKEEDKYMIENFKNALQVDSSLIYDKREGKQCYYIEFSSLQICDDLAKYDIIENKTYLLNDIKIEQISKNLQRHYLRGLLDGDGTIYIDGSSVAVGFCGYNKNFVQSFQYAIDNYLNKTQHNVISKSNAWACKWKGNVLAKKILTYLYEDSTIYLERKKKFYDCLK